MILQSKPLLRYQAGPSCRYGSDGVGKGLVMGRNENPAHQDPWKRTEIASEAQALPLPILLRIPWFAPDPPPVVSKSPAAMQERSLDDTAAATHGSPQEPAPVIARRYYPVIIQRTSGHCESESKKWRNRPFKKGIGVLAVAAALVLAIGWPTFRTYRSNETNDTQTAEREVLEVLPPIEVNAAPSLSVADKSEGFETLAHETEIKRPIVTLVGEIIPMELEESP